MTSEAADSDRERRIEVLVAEYLLAAESGRSPEAQALLSTHPDCAEELRQFLADASWFDSLAGPLQSRYSGAPAPLAAASDGSPGPALDPFAPTASIAAPTGNAHRTPKAFGDFELVEEIGCGGMGVVYRAREPKLDRDVALKMLLSGEFASREQVERFRREAKAAAHLQHENIAKIHRVDEHEGIHYFTMEYIAGRNLAQRVEAQGPLSAQDAAEYMKKIAGAVQYAHEHGTCHRDIKPANILVDEHDQPKLTDFGLAKRLDDHSDLTRSADFLGTASYTSPEQAARRWEDVGAAGDVFSLGATLYYLITGRPPFREPTVAETLLAVIENDPVPPRRINRKISRDLETIVLKCLEKSPSRRYASAQHLADDLERFLNYEPIEAKPRGPIVRAIQWVRGVPLVARLAGRTLRRPTPAQKTTQRVLNAIAGVVLVAFAAVMLWPKPYRVLANAGGLGRCYLPIVEWLCPELERRVGRAVKAVLTGGSNENVKTLARGKATLALTHYSAEELPHSGVMTVAPVYYGVFYVIVREKSHVRTIDDLRRCKRIALGPPSLGMRDAAETILKEHRIQVDNLDETTRDSRLEDFVADDSVDAAVITTGQGHPQLESLFSQGFRAVSLNPEAAKALAGSKGGTEFTLVSVPDGKGGTITSLQSPIVLVANPKAPDALVEAALDALYAPDAKPPFAFLLSQDDAVKFFAKLPKQVPVHPAARKYFKAAVAAAAASAP